MNTIDLAEQSIRDKPLSLYDTESTWQEWDSDWQKCLLDILDDDGRFLLALTGNWKTALHNDRFAIGHFGIRGARAHGYSTDFSNYHRENCPICQREKR